MERVRVEEFEESLCKDCGWVNLIFLWGFSLEILSRSSLYFMGIRGIYTGVRKGCEESVFQNGVDWRLGLATWLSHKSKPRVNWMASLDFLSCSVSASVTVQLLYMLHSCASFGDLQATRSSCESLAVCTILSFSSHSLTHCPYMIPT